MIKIAIYGKGGIGKSTVATHLSAAFAKQGKKVLHVGCDSKFDSSLRLITRKRPITVNEILASRQPYGTINPKNFIMKGVLNIDCIEAGGPEPGLGCGGRGITKMFELFEELNLIEKGNYDIVLFDVLGDVVCGGFAAPLVAGLVKKAYVVISDELLSLYVANNLCKAVLRYQNNGIAMGGLILNKIISKNSRPAKKFAKQTNNKIIAELPWNKDIQDAEKKRTTTIILKPKSIVSAWFNKLCKTIEEDYHKECKVPIPLAYENIFQ